MSNMDLVLNTLKEASEPLKGQQVADISGLDKKEVDKIIKKLKAEEKIISPKRCFYAAK